MTVATLASADTRIYNALAALVATPVTSTAQFGSIDRWDGPVPPTGLPAAKFPAVMLRFDGEQPVERETNTFGWQTDDVSSANWSVLIQLWDPQDVTRGVNGSAAVPGILQLADSVKEAVNGLTLDGASMEQKVLFTGTVREVGAPSATVVYAVRFSCSLDVPSAYEALVAADTSPDIENINGDINIEGTGTPAPNPLVEFTSEPNA